MARLIARTIAHVTRTKAFLDSTAANDKSGAVRVPAIRELFDRGHGRCPQPIDGDGAGGPIIIKIITQVPGPDDD